MRRALPALLVSLAVVVAALYVTADDDGGSPTPQVQGEVSTSAPGSTAVTGTQVPVTATSAAPRGPRGSGRAVTFAFAGDVQFAEEWYTEPGVPGPSAPTLAEQLRTNPRHVLDPIAPVLSGADLAIVNLETAITERGEPVAGKNYHFRSPPASFTALRSAGVDVVSMANNHALDYGPVGMQDTFDAIDHTDVPVIGIGHDAAEAFAPFRTVVHGQRVAVLSAVDWLEPALVDGWTATDTQPGLAFSIDGTRLLATVRAVRPEVDTLVVFLHWGTEETWCASAEQGDLATSLLEAGADLIVGSHAHRVFGAGKVGPSLVAYGLGNFVYFREDGESGRSGVLLATVTGREVDDYSWVPARITDGVPVPQEGAAAAADLAEWEHRRVCSGLAP